MTLTISNVDSVAFWHNLGSVDHLAQFRVDWPFFARKNWQGWTWKNCPSSIQFRGIPAQKLLKSNPDSVFFFCIKIADFDSRLGGFPAKKNGGGKIGKVARATSMQIFSKIKVPKKIKRGRNNISNVYFFTGLLWWSYRIDVTKRCKHMQIIADTCKKKAKNLR